MKPNAGLKSATQSLAKYFHLTVFCLHAWRSLWMNIFFRKDISKGAGFAFSLARNSCAQEGSMKKTKQSGELNSREASIR